MTQILRALRNTESTTAVNLTAGQRMTRRFDAIQRETLAPTAGPMGLFVSGNRRKKLFH